MKYTVKKGDSMYSIAKQFGIPFEEIVRVNPSIQDPDVIYPEQVIELPVEFYPGISASGFTGEGAPGMQGGLGSQISGLTGITGNVGIMPGQIIRPGEKGRLVQLLQHRLKELGYFRGRINGRYGRETVAAITRLQKECRMPVTGMVDYYVWSSLGIRS
ncbi:LysM peptidoglycan-binding domain-containing protein [Phosphitispora sp. TUW77]|uniref:LysM peptidoglycan-binding domain-containing protein n=1 Tax=Phosphitispora sp. TUW77 TaxID=3152361 RepID=UPI003AB61D09